MQQILTKHRGMRNIIQQLRAKTGIQIAWNSVFRFCFGFWLFVLFKNYLNALVAIQHFNSSWPTPSQWKSMNTTWSWEENNCCPHLLSWQMHPWFLIFSPQSSPNLSAILQEPKRLGQLGVAPLCESFTWFLIFPNSKHFPSNWKCSQNFLG